MSRSRANFETVTIPYGAFAVVVGHLEILGQFETIGGTSVFTQSAEHAARKIVGKGSENFAARRLIAQPADDDEIFRAREGTQIARDAECLAGFWIVVEPRRAAVALSHHRALERVLLGIGVLRGLVAKGKPQTFEEVHEEDFTKHFGEAFAHPASVDRGTTAVNAQGAAMLFC